MKQLYQIDSQGFYIGPVIINDGEDEPTDCVGIIPTGLIKPKWDGVKWVEGANQTDLKNTPRQPTDQDRIEALEEALLLLMMEG